MWLTQDRRHYHHFKCCDILNYPMKIGQIREIDKSLLHTFFMSFSIIPCLSLWGRQVEQGKKSGNHNIIPVTAVAGQSGRDTRLLIKWAANQEFFCFELWPVFTVEKNKYFLRMGESQTQSFMVFSTSSS